MAWTLKNPDVCVFRVLPFRASRTGEKVPEQRAAFAGPAERAGQPGEERHQRQRGYQGAGAQVQQLLGPAAAVVL